MHTGQLTPEEGHTTGRCRRRRLPVYANKVRARPSVCNHHRAARSAHRLLCLNLLQNLAQYDHPNFAWSSQHHFRCLTTHSTPVQD